MSGNDFLTDDELKDLETEIDPDEDERELDAIAAGDQPADEPAAQGDAGPADDPADPPQDKADEDEPEPDPEQTDEPQGEPETQATAAAPAPAAVYAEPQIPVVVPPVEDYDNKVKELEDKLAAAKAAYENGDEDALDEDGLRALELQTMRQLARLEAQQEMHVRSVEAARQADINAWDAAFNRFAAGARELDYKDDANFQALVRAVSYERTEAQARGEQLTRAEILERAHRTLLARMGKAPAARPAPKPRENPPGPKTLANLPVAIDGAARHARDEFAHLDELDDVARELAFERMTPEEQARYLAAE